MLSLLKELLKFLWSHPSSCAKLGKLIYDLSDDFPKLKSSNTEQKVDSSAAIAQKLLAFAKSDPQALRDSVQAIESLRDTAQTQAFGRKSSS
ncbi:hypothetical protein [Helicobacter canis]|uniref:hypothetical protein n=1 Tax=Helicobacter canis TaxID=29419 RepID=UPI002943ED2F|nr:hypothetical protein [Helicobacter canis]